MNSQVASSAQADAHPGGGNGRDPIGVIDIGSSSVRMVVFDALKRVPIPLYSEKAYCALGSGIETNGVLSAQAMELAQEALARYVGLARAMRVERLDLVATAAVRDARNRDDFVAEVHKRTGQSVRILSGAEEARLAAMGVLSGQPEAQGVVGDLGGGSLELVAIGQTSAGPCATLPLGSLRLLDAAGEDLGKARTLIDGHLRGLAWLAEQKGRDFYAIGGTWRTLARIHMEQVKYPMQLSYGYTMPLAQALDLTQWVAERGGRSLQNLADLPRWRLDALPFAALLLREILQRIRSERVIFTSFGLREGWVFDLLSDAEKAQDPLLSLVREWAQRDARFGDLGVALTAWTDALFPGEAPRLRRLREAVCHLSDIGWRYLADYRAEHMLLRILRAKELCVEHQERVFLALALYHRYGGERSHPVLKEVLGLLEAPRVRDAEVLGRALRLSWLLCGGAEEMLTHSRLVVGRNNLQLEIRADATVLPGRIVERRLASLANALNLDVAKIVAA